VLRSVLNGSHRFDWSTGVLALVGAVVGAAVVLGWHMARRSATPVGAARLLLYVAAGAVVIPLLLITVRAQTRRLVAHLRLPRSTYARYVRYDTYPYLLLLLTLLSAFGLLLTKLVIALLVAGVGFLQLLLVVYLSETDEQGLAPASLRWVTGLFMVSGFAALIYQVVWQRVLFAAFGVNIESVTIIVSVFMFGLGIGSFVGGWLSTVMPGRLPLLFVACELLIGLFGLVSIPLIETVGTATLHRSLLGISLTIYGLLSFPTLLMGATLPILVTYLHQHYGHVGTSVGTLYWVNTIGSALACFIAVDLLFVVGGLQEAVVVAAACNFAVALLVFRQARPTLRPVGASAARAATTASGPPAPHGSTR
jgi:hypothetical protein